MIYLFCYYVVAIVRIVATTLWYTFGLIGAGTPWLLAIVAAIWCCGQVVQLRRRRQAAAAAAGKTNSSGRNCPGSALARFLLLSDDDKAGGNISGSNGASADLFWAVAHRGADLDAPGNSVAAIKMVQIVIFVLSK